MPHGKVTFDHLEVLSSEIVDRVGPLKSMLYVGWRIDAKPWWHDTLAPKLGVVDLSVLDIFQQNISDLNQLVQKGRYHVRAILGDVRELDKIIPPGTFDVIFWDHGPEHVSESDLNLVTPMLKNHVRKCLLYCCPWGGWPQGVEYGNEYEIHRNSVTPEMFTRLGLQTFTYGSSGQTNDGELLGIYLR